MIASAVSVIEGSAKDIPRILRARDNTSEPAIGPNGKIFATTLYLYPEEGISK
jgi:hypothetical protein